MTFFEEGTEVFFIEERTSRLFLGTEPIKYSCFVRQGTICDYEYNATGEYFSYQIQEKEEKSRVINKRSEPRVFLDFDQAVSQAKILSDKLNEEAKLTWEKQQEKNKNIAKENRRWWQRG